MIRQSTRASSTTFGVTLALCLIGVSGCGAANDDPGTAESTGGSGPEVGAGGSMSMSTGGSANTSTGGSVSASTGGSVSASTGGSASTNTGGSASTNTGGSAGSPNMCEAGTSVQGGGSDTCPERPWRCVDETLGNPPVRLAGAECSPSHTGACCNHGDKCLTNTDGSPGALSAAEVAIEPCQAGCIANPSAQACLDCINMSLVSAGLPEVSTGCGTCWTSLISCSFTNCLAQCVTGSQAPGCRQCVFDHCMVGAGKFNECSGLLSNGGL